MPSAINGQPGDMKLQKADMCSSRELALVQAYADPTSPTFRNGYKSAISAGYSTTYAKTDAHKILKRPRVQRALHDRLTTAANVADLSQAELVRRALHQSDDWLNEDGSRREDKMFDRDGNLSGSRPARVSASNVKALELAGKAAGHIDSRQGGAQVNVNVPMVIVMPDKASTADESIAVILLANSENGTAT